MNIFRRVAIIAIAAVTMSVAANAQEQGDKAVGGNLVIGYNSDFTNVGIGGKFLYNISDAIRLEGAATLFVPKDFLGSKLSFWDIGANVQYLYPVNEKLIFYPLVGLGIQGWKIKEKEGGINISFTGNDLFFDLGGGLDYQINEQLFFNFELKYRIVEDWNRLLILAGIKYKF